MIRTLFRLLPCCLLSSCVIYQEGTGTTPAIAAVARSSVHVMMATPAMQSALIREQADVAVHASRWWTAGDGGVSLRLVDSRGHTLRGIECGGRLFVPGRPGDHGKLLVRNELDIAMRVEVVVHGVHGQRLQVAAHQTCEVPVEFQSVTGPDALHRYDGGEQRGVIDLDVFPDPAKQRLLPQRSRKVSGTGIKVLRQ